MTPVEGGRKDTVKSKKDKDVYLQRIAMIGPTILDIAFVLC